MENDISSTREVHFRDTYFAENIIKTMKYEWD